MGNLGFKFKKFLQNKNTVTLIGTVLVIAILYFVIKKVIYSI